MAISKRLRYEILRRDNHACRYCGAAAPDVPLTVDHVIPVALGGGDEPSNLVTACKSCNAGKSASSPDSPVLEDVRAEALRWSRAMEHAHQAQLVKLEALDTYIQRVGKIWEEWTYPDGTFVDRPENWRLSVERMYGHHIAPEEWRYAFRAAIGHPRLYGDRIWRYAMGVLWRRIEERADAAMVIADQLETDEREDD